MAATAVNPYLSNLYHQQSFFNPLIKPFYGAHPLLQRPYRSKSQKQQKKTPQSQNVTLIKATERGDHTEEQLRPRREPRIRRQVIRLPTPEPVYRQVRHRLPTPERKVIHRTVVRQATGDVILKQQQHKKKTKGPKQLDALF